MALSPQHATKLAEYYKTGQQEWAEITQIARKYW
jgi:hypothetical protein